MEPETSESVAEAEPPISERSAHTAERSLLGSETVHVSMVAVVASAATEAGEKVHEEMTGGDVGAVTVREAVFVPVPPAVSVAVIVRVFAPVEVPVATVMPLRVHVDPDVLVSASVVVPPIVARLTVTVEMLLLMSVTVHVRSVVAMPFAVTEVGENTQVEIVGFGSVTVSDAENVEELAAASNAPVVIE